MPQELNILGIDAGIENVGAGLLRTTGRDTRAIALQRIRLRPDTKLRAWDDVNRRIGALLHELAKMPPHDVVAVEEYMAWGDQGRYKDGWKTVAVIGALKGWAAARGKLFITVTPSAAKTSWHATGKDGVRDALCGAVDGLAVLLAKTDNTGWHVSDAAAVAYEGVRKVFARTLAGAK